MQDLLSFIDQSPSAFHATNSVKEALKNNFIELNEQNTWKLEPNKNYYVCRDQSSIIAFKTPIKSSNDINFKIIGAHTDSPCLKIKPNAISNTWDYNLINIEIYGGVLLNSWFDKDLKIAGRVVVENEKKQLTSRLIELPYKLKIPRLAIHLDRNVNQEGFKINPQSQMLPILGLGTQVNFEELLQLELNTKENILAFDLFLADWEKPCLGGLNNELIYAPRLDNLASVHSSLEAFIKSKNRENQISMVAYFNHEEIGSTSQNGANSNFLENTIKRVCSSFDCDFPQSLSKSFFISCDMAHATHPNYPEKHDPNHMPILGKGPVIKSNANIRYTSNALSIAKFKQWCKEAEVEFQDYSNRNDLGCGSTIGPMVSSNLGIESVDVGNPMLSMHSIREMAEINDHKDMIKVFECFYK